MTLEVPFFNYPALFQEKEAEMMALIQDVLQRGAYILQKELEELRKQNATLQKQNTGVVSDGGVVSDDLHDNGGQGGSGRDGGNNGNGGSYPKRARVPTDRSCPGGHWFSHG